MQTLRAPILSGWLMILAVAGAAGCRDKTPKLTAVPMSGALAPVSGNSKTDGEIALYQVQLRSGLERNETIDPELWVKLARAFIRKAREKSDPLLYQQAEDAAERALALAPENLGALQVRQVVLVNQHKFAEAFKLASAQIKRMPRDSVSWGTLGDAALELGDYDGATAAYQAMMDIKPDLRSYNRGAWMRWLIGDSDGAVELMGMAVDSGSVREPEPRAYCRVQLADLYFWRGEYEKARAGYDLALREIPGYAPAHLARGRLNLALSGGQADSALFKDGLADLETARKLQPLPTVRWLYVDALLAAGRKAEADAESAVLEKEGEREDPRTVSLFLSTHKQKPELAVKLAQEEALRRPDIWSLDALAWAQHRAGQKDAAWAAIQQATRLGTPDPRLLFHRGAIAAARGDKTTAVASLRKAFGQSPKWDLQETAEARELLKQLGEPAP